MRRCRRLLVCALLLVATADRRASAQRSSSRSPSATSGATFDDPEEMDGLNRELWAFARRTPYDAAVRHALRAQARARAASQQVVLPTGWRIAPAGSQLDVGRMPYDAVHFAGRLLVLNGGYYLAESEQPEITVVDPERQLIVKTLRVSSLYPSAAALPGGNLYVSGGSSDSLFEIDRRLDVVRAISIPGYGGPVAAVDSTHLAVALLTMRDSAGATGPGVVALLDTRSGVVTGEVRAGYFPSSMLATRGKLYVTLVGEHRVLVYDVRGGAPRLLRSVATGRAPQSLCADSTHVYAVNSASDDVTALALDDAIVARYAVTFPGRATTGARFGSAPTSCVVSSGRLYVTAAGMNAVAVFDIASAGARDTIAAHPTGFIPTAWYPTRVTAAAGHLAILSAKGIRSRRPNPQGPQAPTIARQSGPDYVLMLLRGSLSLVPESTLVAQLPLWTRLVATGAPYYSAADGLRLPIKHVFYIVRENRSYDQVLGDLGRGDGDSSLTLFGAKITPVAHQLAREFATLDHFYVDGEISVLGHSFTTSGYASPFLEWLGNTSYAGRYHGYPFGTVPAIFSPAYLWDALEAKHVSYRVYGEPYYLFTRLYRLIVDHYGAESALAKRFYARSMALADSTDRGMRFTRLGESFTGGSSTAAGAASLLADTLFVQTLSDIFAGDRSIARAIAGDASFRDGVAQWLTHYMLGYPTWNLGFSDLDRIALWKADFTEALRDNRVPAFSYLWLPNDHTAGANTSFPNPFQLVAQNDAALGQLVETISTSPIWRESLIIVEEDDAQNGPDHLDATRTVALVAGAYVKRRAVVSDRYDQLSALRTVELLLGLDPLNLGDATAVPMFGALTPTADTRPFHPVAPSELLMAADRERLAKMKQ